MPIAAVDGTVSKGEFAELIGVSPGRVSQYIAERKIFGDAIEGEGRRARIRADVARSQLLKTLEPSQRLGANGALMRSGPSSELPFAPPSPLQTPPKPASADDVMRDELAAERLKQQRLKTAQAEREEALATGRYMLTDDARREMARAVGDAFKVMDQGLRAMANAVAAELGVPERDAHQVLAKSFRALRAEAASGFRVEAAGHQRMITDAGDEPERVAS
jgi:DNA-binding transcriptional regulator YdaS (Cro superfamily)